MTNDTSMGEIALWQNFKAGDQAAFDTLVRQHYALLLNYGVRLVNDKILTQDNLQDFFLDLWAKRDNLGDAQNIKAYLISSFRRRLLRSKNSTSRLKIVGDTTDDYDFEVEFNIESALIDVEQKAETLAKLEHHLSTLTKRQREAIYLRFYQKLEYPEIADIMSVNHHSAVNLVYGAIKLLRQNWVSLCFLIFYLFFLKIRDKIRIVFLQLSL